MSDISSISEDIPALVGPSKIMLTSMTLKDNVDIHDNSQNTNEVTDAFPLASTLTSMENIVTDTSEDETEPPHSPPSPSGK